jgi:hypothetical protein
MERANNTAALAPAQLAAVVEASKRARKVRRCAGIATFGGWTTGAFGGLTLLCLPLSFSWSGLFIGAALGVAALGEFHGASLVRGFDPRGARRLAMNQVMLGACLVIYAVWCLAQSLVHPSSMQSGDPNLDAMVAGWNRIVALGLYGTLAAVGVVAPGLTAWYYASRARSSSGSARKTEASVVEALKAA